MLAPAFESLPPAIHGQIHVNCSNHHPKRSYKFTSFRNRFRIPHEKSKRLITSSSLSFRPTINLYGESRVSKKLGLLKMNRSYRERNSNSSGEQDAESSGEKSEGEGEGEGEGETSDARKKKTKGRQLGLGPVGEGQASTTPESVMNVLGAAYRFSKPFTVTGAALSVFSVCLIAVEKLSDFTPLFFLGVSQAVVGIVLAHLYVAGIDQVTDIDIDKINKPHMPLASGRISVRTGILIMSFYVLLGVLLGWRVGSWPLNLGMFTYFASGNAYSLHLPLLRWKRVHVLAALVMVILLGVNPIFFFLHVQSYVFGRPMVISNHVIFVTIYMSIYAVALAIFKDIPDVKGDRLNGINTFAIQLGQKRAFWLAISVIELAYGVAILFGLSSPYLWVKSIMVLSHGILGFILWKKACLVDAENNVSVAAFYMFLYKLYYMEYLLVPIIRF